MYQKVSTVNTLHACSETGVHLKAENLWETSVNKTQALFRVGLKKDTLKSVCLILVKICTKP